MNGDATADSATGAEYSVVNLSSSSENTTAPTTSPSWRGRPSTLDSPTAEPSSSASNAGEAEESDSDRTVGSGRRDGRPVSVQVYRIAAKNIARRVFELHESSGFQTDEDPPVVDNPLEQEGVVPCELPHEQRLEAALRPETFLQGDVWPSTLPDLKRTVLITDGTVPDLVRHVSANLKVVHAQGQRALSILALHSAALTSLTTAVKELRDVCRYALGHRKDDFCLERDPDLRGMPFSTLAQLENHFRNRIKVEKLCFYLLTSKECGAAYAKAVLDATMGAQLQRTTSWRPNRYMNVTYIDNSIAKVMLNFSMRPAPTGVQYLPRFFEYCLLLISRIAHELHAPAVPYNEQDMENQFRAALQPDDGETRNTHSRASKRTFTEATSMSTSTTDMSRKRQRNSDVSGQPADVANAIRPQHSSACPSAAPTSASGVSASAATSHLPAPKSYKASWTHLDRVELGKTRLAEVADLTKAGAPVHDVIAMLNKIYADCSGADSSAKGRVKYFCSKITSLSLRLYGVLPDSDWRRQVASCNEELKDV